MRKFRDYELSIELLQRYSAASVQNASELLEEAKLLKANGHKARAYFLAVASIEETGKAQLAFDAQGRKLNDSAVATKVRKSFEDHSAKITAAFIPWLLASSNIEQSAKAAIALMIDLKFGREPSMYTDVKEDGVSVQSPSGLVRPEAAEDCIRLAGDCLANARRHFEGKEPVKTTRAQDEFFAMRSTLTREIMNSVDFWDFHIDRLKVGLSKLEESVTEYNRLYFQKHVNYKASEVDATDT